MSKQSVANFIDHVRRSKLVSSETLREALRDWKRDHNGQYPANGRQTAKYLIERKLLTAWQCGKLLAGKYKGFFLADHKLLDLLGAGGMSSVYLAENQLTDELEAIKVLPRNKIHDSSYLKRFQREAKTARQLIHDNIVRTFSLQRQGKNYYIVMEYIEGKNLQQIVEENGALDVNDAARYIAQAAQGLDYAHEQRQIIHRDIKPANLLVNEKQVVKILDLGLVLPSDDDSGLTEEHNERVLGTADYLSPEQAVNSHNITKLADIYGLGCCFYFLLTGRPPFPEGTLAQRIIKHQTKMPAEIRTIRPDCPPELVKVCVKMIQKKPIKRFQRAQEVADVLHAWLQKNAKAAIPHHAHHHASGNSDKPFSQAAAKSSVAHRASGDDLSDSTPVLVEDSAQSAAKKPSPAPGDSSSKDTVSSRDRGSETVKGLPDKSAAQHKAALRKAALRKAAEKKAAQRKAAERRRKQSGSPSAAQPTPNPATGPANELPIAEALDQNPTEPSGFTAGSPVLKTPSQQPQKPAGPSPEKGANLQPQPSPRHTSPSTSPRRRRSRFWIGFFLTLLSLAVIGVAGWFGYQHYFS